MITTDTGAKKWENSDNWRQIYQAHNESVDAEDAAIAALQDAIAIVANGNTHAAIASGQFVFVKNHDTLAAGLYTANAAIAANATLTSSNLTADPSGGLNALNSNINTTYRDIYGNGSINNCNDAEIGKWYHVYPSASNVPTQNTGILFTYGNSGDRHQICESASRYFVRRYTGSAWTNWEELALNSKIVVDTYDAPVLSWAAGTPGTYIGDCEISTSKSGYAPAAVSVSYIAHGTYIPVIGNIGSTKVLVSLYRADSSAHSYSQGDFKIKVLFNKA